MKRNLTTLVFTMALASAFGQSKQIELFALIQKIVPDSVKPNQLGDWSQTRKKDEVINWTRFYCDAASCQSEGDLTLSAKKEFNENNPVTSNLMITGTQKGYDEINISTSGNFEGDIKGAKDIFLGGANYKSTLLKYCKEDKDGSSYAAYKISVPGKVPFWLAFLTSFTNSGNAVFDIYLYLGKYKGPTKCK